jgi:hypothetical protein
VARELVIGACSWRYTAAVSILRFDNDAFNAFNFQIFTQVGFLWSIPTVQLGEHLDRTKFVGCTHLADSDWQVADLEQLFRGPLKSCLDCLGQFFFRRVLQFRDQRLDVLPPCAFAGTGGELRTLWVTSEFCRLDDLTPEKPVLDVDVGLGAARLVASRYGCQVTADAWAACSRPIRCHVS